MIEILLLIGVGAIAGLIAGLLGVGGGTIIVPALIFLFEFTNTNTDQMVQMSVATSMACIVITSISSTYAHHQKKGVMWDLVKSIGIGIPLGAIFGVLLVNLISGFILKILIVIFMICLSRVSQIKNEELNAGLKLGLLDNEENLFDLGLYVGLGGTVLSLILLLVLDVKQDALIGAYTSTLFGILFVAALKIVIIRPYRNHLLVKQAEEKGV